jgi:hypothetical protein
MASDSESLPRVLGLLFLCWQEELGIWGLFSLVVFCEQQVLPDVVPTVTFSVELDMGDLTHRPRNPSSTLTATLEEFRRHRQWFLSSPECKKVNVSFSRVGGSPGSSLTLPCEEEACQVELTFSWVSYFAYLISLSKFCHALSHKSTKGRDKAHREAWGFPRLHPKIQMPTYKNP